MDLNDVKAGKYELVVLHWEQILSKPGQPFDFVRHHRGDIVDLNVGDAKRLYAAGAIRSLDEEPGAEKPGAGPSVPPGVDPDAPVTPDFDLAKATVEEVMTWVGDDPGRAGQALDVEEAKASTGGKVRSTLVEALEKIVEAADQGGGGE